MSVEPDERALEGALSSLLAPDERTGDRRADLIAAARRALERRFRNSRDGGTVIHALHELEALSWRQIEQETGIPQGTARRWHEPPQTASGDS